MAKRKNERQSSVGNDDWSPATLGDPPLEPDFVRDGFTVLEGFVNEVDLKNLVPLVNCHFFQFNRGFSVRIGQRRASVDRFFASFRPRSVDLHGDGSLRFRQRPVQQLSSETGGSELRGGLSWKDQPLGLLW